MAIPKYNEIYNVFLESISDGEIHTLAEIKPAVIERFHITEEEQA